MRALPFVALATLATSLCAQTHVSPSGSDITGTGTPSNPYRTISFAAAVAVNGETILLAAGTYGDDDQILLGQKNLAIVGAGPGSTMIVPSPTEVLSLPSGVPPGSPADFRVGITIDGPARIDIRDLTIDGAFRMPASDRLVGLFIRNGADATLDNVEIKNVRAEPLSGAQGPVGIIVRGDGGVDPCDVRIRSCTLTEWGKGGIVALFNSNVIIEHSTVRGLGPVVLGGPAQNGIQISDGAVGTLRHNVVTDVRYVPSSYAGTGILLFNAGVGSAVEGNSVTRCEDNIALVQQPAAAAEASVRGNKSTQAFNSAVRIEGNTGVSVTNNVLHGADLGFSPAFDSAGVGNIWQNNNYSDWTGVGSYGIPGGGLSDPQPRRDCDEFSGSLPVSLAGAAQDIVVAQLDGAGRRDIAAVTAGVAPSLAVALESLGGYTVSKTGFGTANGSAVAIVAGEFDGAPGVDLAAITASIPSETADNRIYVFSNDGLGSFSLLHVEQMPLVAFSPSDLAAGDVDGNGLDDLVVAHFGNGAFPGGGNVYRNVSGGTIWQVAALAGPTLRCGAVAVGQLDGNGSVDIALTEGNGTTGRLRIYANNGLGAFSEVGISPIAVPANPTAAAIMDTDGDGAAEVLVTSWAGASPTNQRGALSIVQNQLPVAMPVQRVPTDLGPSAIATGDIGLDIDPDTPRPDAVVLNASAATLNLFGEFGPAGPAQGSICLGGSSPVAVALADMDGDAYVDLLVADALAPNLTIRFGRPTARADLYGAGCPGFQGRVPLTSTGGSPGVSQQPNPMFQVHLGNGRPVAPAVYMIGFPSGFVAPCTLMVNPVIVVPVVTDSGGAVALPLPISTNPSLTGVFLYTQWAVLDDQSAFLNLVTLTQGLVFRVGI